MDLVVSHDVLSPTKEHRHVGSVVDQIMRHVVAASADLDRRTVRQAEPRVIVDMIIVKRMTTVLQRLLIAGP